MVQDADTILDRRRMKRRLSWWRAAAIVAVAALVLGALNQLELTRTFLPGRDYIARVTISGVIVDDPNITDAIAAVAEDDRARALIVLIDSPGGTTTGGEVLFRELRRVAETGKPVVSVVSTLGASAGYLVAMAGDRIYALETSLTGSIGVLMETAEVTGLLEKLGVKTDTIKSAPLKGTPSPMEALTPAARAAAQEVVDDTYNWFVDILAARRGFTRAEALTLADGRVFTGRQALANKLIDGIGAEREATEWLTDARGVAPNLPTRDIDPPLQTPGILDFLVGLSKKALVYERLKLDGLISVWHPQQ